jgi:hypothetical protein
MSPSCQHCHCRNDTVSERQFAWQCRPREKDLERGQTEEDTIFDIELCEACYQFAIANNTEPLRGFDWWEAFDSLKLPTL